LWVQPIPSGPTRPSLLLYDRTNVGDGPRPYVTRSVADRLRLPVNVWTPLPLLPPLTYGGLCSLPGGVNSRGSE